jgi:hypothetical protein
MASDQVLGTARWHLWCPEAGQINAAFFMQVPAGEADHVWHVDVGGEKHTFKANAGDGLSQPAQTVSFTVLHPGKVTFTLDCTATPPPPQTRFRYVTLQGSAITRASLLRARYRPSAAHGRFFAPQSCPTPRMWVFETMDVAGTDSYSPLTTPFGYFGLVFTSGGIIPAGSGFNFSMWIAGRSATQAPPIDKMACLIATDLPDAAYSTFGGEGTGVKFRGIVYQQPATRTIQALRDLRTFYGYFYDEPAARWKLYASAQQPAERKNRSGLLSSTGSFCEIPGPPAVERSGDRVREIKRRGWFYGSDQRWYRAQISPDDTDANAPDDVPDPAPGDAPAPDTRTRRKPAAATNPAAETASSQRFYYTSDYPTDGWIAMSTGGIEAYIHRANTPPQPPKNNATPAPFPEYLTPERTAQLFALPVLFGPSKTSELAPDHATIDYQIKQTGPRSKAILYYGTIDSRTYPPRHVTTGSAVEIDMFRPERTWQFATPELPVTTGVNRFTLAGLATHTRYYYRLFVAHDAGKSWDYQSGNFTTP